MDKIRLFATVFLLSVAINANAALNDLGNGLVNDTTLNITWLQDANMVKTLCDANDPLWQSWPEPDPEVTNNTGRTKAQICTDDGSLNWFEAEAWIAHLNSNSYLGYSNWRQPITNQPDATCSYQDTSYNPSQGSRYNCEGSELAHLFNVTLSNLNYLDNTCFGDCLVNTGPFSNFQDYAYWSGTEYAPDPTQAWALDVLVGGQGFGSKTTNNISVWPVRPGNVAATPASAPQAVPATGIWGLGLLGLLLTYLARRRLG